MTYYPNHICRFNDSKEYSCDCYSAGFKEGYLSGAEGNIVWWKEELREALKGMKIEVAHVDECLATQHGDSYCDCLEYTATTARNWALDEILALLDKKDVTK
jgi:hypothetical protein